jgi:DNA replication protein DnaC
MLVMNEFEQWMNSDRAPNVLHGIGGPGSGKTIMA